jgi:hypothetical protein
LHFSSEQLNGTAGPIAVTNADGVQVAVYFGNVTDTGGPFSLADAGAISSVANTVANTQTQTIPGFAAFPNVDPAIIGDVSLQGNVNSTDAGAMTQEVGGNARITIPYAPIGLQVTQVGPDPTLSLPTSLTAAVGSSVIMPVYMGKVTSLQQPVAVANTVGVGVLPKAVVEKVYGSRHNRAIAVQQGPSVQPDAILTAQTSDVAQSSIRDLAATPTQPELGQQILLSKNDLAYLWQTASDSLLAPVPGLLADDPHAADVVDVAGLDAAIGIDVVAQVRKKQQV